MGDLLKYIWQFSFSFLKLCSIVAFAANGKAYVGTGYVENDNKLKNFWEYNPSTNTWTRIANFGGTARYKDVYTIFNGQG